MNTVQYGNLIISVDVEGTQKYYAELTLCDCGFCKYYSSNIGGRFPKLEEFLESFGVDIKKPDETAPIKTDYGMLFTMVGYTACGQIEQGEKEEIEIEGFKLSFCNGFDFPNEQKQEYFSITVHNLTL